MKEAIIQRILDEKVVAIVRGYTEEECLNLAKERDISVVVETKTIAGLKQSAAWLHENWK